MKKQIVHGVAFDLDGVLVATEHLHEQAWRAAVTRLAPDRLASLNYSGLVGKTEAACARAIAGPKGDPAGLRAQKWREFQSLARAEVAPDQRLTDALMALADEGIAVCVVTSGTEDQADLLLTLRGIRSHFQTVVTRESVREAKPSPEPYQLAARLTGIEPSRLLVFEDSVPGIAAASSAGCPVVVIDLDRQTLWNSISAAGRSYELRPAAP